MFTGLCAFPLTPINEGKIDDMAFIRLMARLVEAGVDSVCALGSTGSYAYLGLEERKHVARLAIQNAGKLPVLIGVSALRTQDVLKLADDAQHAGASGLLLAPMSYQPLTENEVFSLYESLSQAASVPLVVYDNPRTTHFEFSDELHGRIAQLPGIASIKIPAVPADLSQATARVDRLRKLIPSQVTIGVSGDGFAATGLRAGCDTWYSVIAGLFPKTALALTQAAQAGNTQILHDLEQQLSALWTLFNEHGSIRVIATAAEELGLVKKPSLPLPLLSLDGEVRTKIRVLVSKLEPYS